MRNRYDFSAGKKNPYATRLKQQVTMRVDTGTIDYFKALAKTTGIPYQTLMNLYLRECAAAQKRLEIEWVRRERR